MENYRIEIPHFYCLDYYEANRIMRLDIDFRDPIIYLSIDLIEKWLPPNEDIVITQVDKDRILKNIYCELIKNNSRERIVLE